MKLCSTASREQPGIVDAAKYNLIQGLVGETFLIPTCVTDATVARTTALLKKWRESRIVAFSEQQAGRQTGGGQ
jgi:hypothetical protein